MPTRRRSRTDLERHGPMKASSKLPTEERPTRYAVVGANLRAAREAASMTVGEVAALCGYGSGVIEAMEAGATYHTVTISRVASVIPGHDLSQIREE